MLYLVKTTAGAWWEWMIRKMEKRVAVGTYIKTHWQLGMHFVDGKSFIDKRALLCLFSWFLISKAQQTRNEKDGLYNNTRWHGSSAMKELSHLNHPSLSCWFKCCSTAILPYWKKEGLRASERGRGNKRNEEGLCVVFRLCSSQFQELSAGADAG